MASLKALEYEKKLLKLTGDLKTLVLRQFKGGFIEDDEAHEHKQQFLIQINNLFELAHEEPRRLRKALAFLHADNEAMAELLKKKGIPKPEPKVRFINTPHLKDDAHGTEGSGSSSA